MKLPDGTDCGVITNLQDEGLVRYLMTFRGALVIDSTPGNGFLITDNGNLLAAYFSDSRTKYRGKAALDYLIGEAGRAGTPRQKYSLRSYEGTEFQDVIDLCTRENLMLVKTPGPKPAGVVPQVPGSPPEVTKKSPALPDESTLKKVLAQPGVIAVSVFFEGFPVRSIGDADFEHVAALAEDLMRAGARIAEDMNIGNLNQLILETAENKFIIAPCGDLFLCIFTRADSQLGLIRVILKSIQMEFFHEQTDP